MKTAPQGTRKVGMHIYVLPNLLTIMNMFAGFYAIIMTIEGNYIWAAYAIVVGAIFDQLDGRVARIANATSRFGAELDSLCDLVTFGLAPGLLLFLWSLEPFGRVGWLASFFYVACGALRLARFNVQSGSVEKAYFQGLPIPMAAGIVASCILAFQDLELDAARHWGILAMTFLLGFVMVSTFRYRSFKDIDFRHRLPFRYLPVGVFLFVMVALRPETTLFVLFLSYATLGAVFGIWRLGSRHPRNMKPYSPEVGEDLHEELESHDSN